MVEHCEVPVFVYARSFGDRDPIEGLEWARREAAGRDPGYETFVDGRPGEWSAYTALAARLREVHGPTRIIITPSIEHFGAGQPGPRFARGIELCEQTGGGLLVTRRVEIDVAEHRRTLELLHEAMLRRKRDPAARD